MRYHILWFLPLSLLFLLAFTFTSATAPARWRYKREVLAANLIQDKTNCTNNCKIRMWRCPLTCQCIPNLYILDEITDCLAGEDEDLVWASGALRCEQDCNPGKYRCGGNCDCHPSSVLFDGVQDCEFSEDENVAIALRLNECALQLDICDPMAECKNLVNGLYMCICPNSYSGVTGVACWTSDVYDQLLKLGLNDTVIGLYVNQTKATDNGLEKMNEEQIMQNLLDFLMVRKPAPGDKRCENNSVGCTQSNQCIPLENILDGVDNCEFGEDEDPAFLDECSLGIAQCSPGRSTCENVVGAGYKCTCLPEYSGNGVLCLAEGERDPSLEYYARLGGPYCKRNEFQCGLKGNDPCISIDKLKNDVEDCQDGSDEFCFPHQVKCGQICVEAVDFTKRCLGAASKSIFIMHLHL